MAVGSFMKTGGLAALALAIALPSAAFAQDRWINRGGGQQAQPQPQAQPQAQQQQQVQQQSGGGNRWQGRGDGGNRGGWQGRGNGGNAQPRAVAPQAAPQVQVQPQAQARSRWQGGNGGGDAARSWRQNNPQQNVQRNWSDQNRGDANRWRGNNNNQARGNDNRWQGNDRNRADGNRNWSGNNNRNWNGNNNRGWNNNWRSDNRYNWFSYRNSNRDVFRLGRYNAPYRGWSYRRLGIGFMLQPLFYSSSYWIDDPEYYRLPEAYGPYRWVRYYDDALLVDIYSGEVIDEINNFFW